MADSASKNDLPPRDGFNWPEGKPAAFGPGHVGPETAYEWSKDDPEAGKECPECMRPMKFDPEWGYECETGHVFYRRRDTGRLERWD